MGENDLLADPRRARCPGDLRRRRGGTVLGRRRVPSSGPPRAGCGPSVPGVQSWQYLQTASEMPPEQRQVIKDEWIRNAGKVAGSNQDASVAATLPCSGTTPS